MLCGRGSIPPPFCVGGERVKVSVLGETYEILLRSGQEDPKLKECDGYCDWTTKTIVIDRMDKPDVMDVGNIDTYMRKVIRAGRMQRMGEE